MVLVEKAKGIITDVRAYWRVPAAGDYVAYKEYLMLSLGWLGMRLATTFGIAFSVNNPFTAMTLHMEHRDLLILGYICTAISYALAPLNAYIIDNLKSRVGKYKVFVRLAVPSGILSLFAIFYPYEKMSYIPMIVSLFVIGQIQGYVQGWYNTGVSNLVYVISPNSRERVKIITVASLVHNFAPSITGLLIPMLSDVLAGGDLYNIRTYRLVYPAFIIVGVALSMTSYYGVSERIVEPKSRATGIGLIEALRDVSRNKLFWIKCTDNWNNFMEDSKNVLMQWLFYYGKVGSMTMYGIMDTVSYNSSMWAMLFSPWMIDKMGKKGFKIVKNVSQVFITLGLALTYKKSLALIFIFYFLNRFWETTEVIDRSIESDIRDYQQYISGERIDGSFGVVDTYVGGAIGAVTNLFVPWVYRRNGFDGTDYDVLNVYDSNGVYKENNLLYPLLDKLLWISLAGAIIDIFPWFLYDLSDTDQKSVLRVIRLRSAIEDKNEGMVDDGLYCEACEAVISMKENLGAEKAQKLTEKQGVSKKEIKESNRQIKAANEEIDIASFLSGEISKYSSEFGSALISLCTDIFEEGPSGFFASDVDFEARALALPQAESKDEKRLRGEAIRMSRAVKSSVKAVGRYYPNGFREFSASGYEALYDLPDDTKELRKQKNALIRKANKERRSYGKVMKPYLWAKRNVVLSKAYDDIDAFIADYPAVRQRLDEKIEAERAEEARRLEERKAKAQAKKLK